MIEKPNMSQKEKIKLAAVKIFSQKGFHSSSVQEIADEAGVKKSLFFYYFKSKENLFLSMFKEGIKEVVKKIRAINAQKVSPCEKLKAILKFEAKLYVYILEKGVLRWGTQSISECPNADFVDMLKDDILTMVMLVEEIIKEGISIGVFRKIDSYLMAVSILSAHQMLLRDKIVFDKEVSEERFHIFLNNLFLEGLML